ncbi:hypothetical protein OEZ86_003276 [Tetradesmus obliquus]|nr:hypothetical protein OEZ86_003276 [Tetradesmus obliquus]
MEATLLRGIDALWPAGSHAAEDRVKRAAALYLLSQPDKEASSSFIAGSLTQSVGPVKTLGINKSFKQILSSDPCFIMEQRYVSEAWWSLNHPLLNPVSAINALWPAEAADAEARIKRSAAMALYLSPSNCSSSVPAVAAAVDKDVGSTKKLGLSKSFGQAQFGVTLAGVLDTQLLAGLTNLAARSAGQSAAAAADRAADGGGSSSSAACQWDGAMGRVGLGRLYEACGFPEPTKGSMAAAFDANPRLWFSRPLPADAIEYAADDVRYLLPAAHSLLQQLPAALMALGSLQQLLSQQGPQALRLQQQLLPGYGKLLVPADTQGGVAAVGGSSSSSGSSAGIVAQRGLTQMQFELRAQFTPANTGWFTSSFVVYLNEEHNPATAAAAAAAASGSGKLLGVDGSKAVLQAGDNADAAAAAGGGALPGANGLAGDAGAGCGSSGSSTEAGDVDEAVLSIAELLPDSDNRMGVPGSLHRISAMRNRQGDIYGLTYRVGRHLPGVALLLADLLSSMKASLRGELGAERPQSLLLLGRPGTGKTTLLRDIARLMSLPPSEGGLGLAVIIVDTSNEIAGDAEECHTCIGRARRMMVARREEQAGVLVEAVQNHNPDVVVVDEIGTAKEVAAARTICERGVLLVGTAHGSSLAGLLRNPELRPLLGGLAAVTLGDAEAKASNAGHKTRFERAGAATFVTLLELQAKNT